MAGLVFRDYLPSSIYLIVGGLFVSFTLLVFYSLSAFVWPSIISPIAPALSVILKLIHRLTMRAGL